MKRILSLIVFLSTSAPLLAEPYAWPVPYVASRDGNHINFFDLPNEGTLKIYTIVGEPVFSFSWTGQNTYQWTAINSDGKKVATGVYLFLIEGGGQKKDGKVVVIR